MMDWRADMINASNLFYCKTIKFHIHQDEFNESELPYNDGCGQSVAYLSIT
jgi:hypothetical protein